MKLHTILIASLILMLSSCVEDPKVAAKNAPQQPTSSAPVAQQAPSVKVNPDSPAFAPSQGKSLTTKSDNKATPEQMDQLRAAAKKEGLTDAQIDAKLKGIKSDVDLSQPTQQPKPQPKSQPTTTPTTGRLSSACSLLNPAFIAEVIGVDKDYITVKESITQTNTQRSCFFRWDHEGMANNGVLVQIQNNPFPEEHPEWPSYYIAAKRNQGDKSPDSAVTYRYKHFTEVGVSGAYNYDLARYYWRTEKGQVLMVAFNLPATEEVQYAWGTKMAKEVMRNLR